MSADEAVHHLLAAGRHASLALDAVLPEPLRARHAELRRQCLAALRALVEEAARQASRPDDQSADPAQPTRIKVE